MKWKPREVENKIKEGVLKVENGEEEEEEDSTREKEDTNLLARKFTRFFSQNKKSKGKNFLRHRVEDDDDKGKSDIICYKKLDHIKQDCL